MRRLLLAFMLLFAALPASARERGVADPRAFVAAAYARYQANPDTPPPDRSFTYSTRLRRLVAAYDAWQRVRADQELVDALDFDWWINAQDYQIRSLALTERIEAPARRWIQVAFDNHDRPRQIRFLFVREGRRWYLDEIVSGWGREPEGWTLSVLLQRREE